MSEASKLIANEIFGILEDYKAGQCTYDRALERAATQIDLTLEKRPINGYFQSGSIKEILTDLVKNKKKSAEVSYLFNCTVHQNTIAMAERILEKI